MPPRIAGPSRPARASITYAELSRRAAAVADRLGPLVAPDARVAVCFPRDTTDLYAAQLGTLLSGAAFVCLDPSSPDGHIAAVLTDAAPAAILTDGAGAERLATFIERVAKTSSVDASSPRPVILTLRQDGPVTDGRVVEHSAPDLPTPAIAPSDLAYLNYTSGTTGRPKGVMIEHRSIVRLVASDVADFALTPDDRVAQVSSPAYDSSIEESWLAFAAGATLVVLDDTTVRLGPDLVGWLARERITVLCPPPTLLRMMACPDPASALPGLRLLYVGGEALPQDVADVWSRGRRMVNGYGPTECTVTVVRGAVTAGQPVTIGRAVDGSAAHVLPILDPRPAGEVDFVDEGPSAAEGELCIAGLSLARGYFGQPALTAERFPTHPRLGRIYRTGDRVRRTPAGDLVFLGRMDAQVKIRGHRVELEAIDAHLSALPGVRAAAASLQGDGPAAVLVAHIVPERPDMPPDPETLSRSLATVLPDHMVPRRYAVLSALPTSVGGKLDRRALPPVAAPTRGAPAAADRPRDAVERRVAAAYADALGHDRWTDASAADGAALAIGRDDDFFTTLGGTSLSAVAVILTLRAASTDPDADAAAHALAGVSVRDVYEAPTVAALADRAREAAAHRAGVSGAGAIDGGSAAGAAPVPAANDAAARGGGRPLAVTAVQTAWLAGHVVAGSAVAYAAALVVWPWLLVRLGVVGAVVLVPVVLAVARVATVPLAIGWAAGVKRVVVGRYAAGRQPVWGAFHARHWIATHAARTIPWGLIAGTEWSAVALRALGARVGRRVHVHRGVDLGGGGWDVMTLGDDVTLGQDAAPRAVTFEDGAIVVGALSLADGATLEVRAGLGPGAEVGRGGQLTALSYLPPGGAVPPGERWDGVPAVRRGQALDAPAVAGGLALRPDIHAVVTVCARAFGPLVWAIPFFGLAAAALQTARVSGADLASWLAAPSGVATVASAAAVLSAAGLALGLAAQVGVLGAVGRVRPGTYDRLSLHVARAMFKAGVVASAGTWLSGSIAWPAWLRAAGMRIGRGGEVSTIIGTVPECTAIGADAFLADGVYLGGPSIDRGGVTIAMTTLGRDTFVGNHSVLTAGHDWPDGLFVGVATAPAASASSPGAAWFGHPPFGLPRRDVVAADREWTHAPDRLRWWTRAFWEALRFALPAWPITVAIGWLAVVAHAAARLRALPFGRALLLGVVAPGATLGAAAVLVASVIVLKWALLGRVRPGRHAFWSCWCGRWDFVYMAWGIWAHGVLTPLEGTLWLNAVLRLFGMDIGRRVLLGTGFAHVVDPDMLHLADDAIVQGQFQAHSFEDRILKIDHVRIGRGATIGHNAVVFYAADVGAAARVVPHSVVMKGDVLAAGVTYVGCPTRPAGPPASSVPHGQPVNRPAIRR